MQNPADLQSIILLGATNAVANTAKIDAILAAPGLTFRYRIWTIAFGVSNNAVGAFIMNGFLRDTTGIRHFYMAVHSTGSPYSTIVFPGGVVLESNGPIQWETFCAAAAQQYRLLILYTREATG